MKTRISIEEALELLLSRLAPVGSETVPLWELNGRVLAGDLSARLPVPPFDRSPYDGYTLIAADTAVASEERPVTLRITEELPAGTAPTVPLRPGFAAKILTGAPLPEGADVTVKYEDTVFTPETVTLSHPLKADHDVVRKGEDVQAGELLASAGTRVTPPLLGLLAGQGFAEARVFRRPQVAVLSTGSELCTPGEPLPEAHIYNSNVYTLSAYLAEEGAVPVNGGVVPDEPDEIAARITSLLAQCDMILTTGGASVGDYDWAVRVSERLGAEILFWKVAFKPGGSMSAALLSGKLILSLSGNPGAAAVGFMRLGLPCLRRLCGMKETASECVTVVLRGRFAKASPQRRLVRGRLEVHEGVACFVPNDGQGNGVVSSLLGCDLLAELPAGTPPLEDGALLRAYRV